MKALPGPGPGRGWRQERGAGVPRRKGTRPVGTSGLGAPSFGRSIRIQSIEHENELGPRAFLA